MTLWKSGTPPPPVFGYEFDSKGDIAFEIPPRVTSAERWNVETFERWQVSPVARGRVGRSNGRAGWKPALPKGAGTKRLETGCGAGEP